MTTYRNDSKGRRGILLAGGNYAWLAPGETKTVRGDKIIGVPNGLIEVDAKGDPASAPLPEPPAGLAEQIEELPSLSGMNKAQLTAQAKVESVDLSGLDKPTNAQITAAIEAKRAARGE